MRPEHLLQRLDDLGAHLATRGDTIALIGLGSVGAELDRLDEHSDLDFFVVVADGAKQHYLDDIGWLSAPCPVAYSFANTVHGRKALYADGIFAEYAIFTVAELAEETHHRGRIVWQRHDAPAGLEASRREPLPPDHSVEHQLNEALTNLYIGLHRDARGERLTAARFIQQYAIDRLITLLALADPPSRRDPYDVTRRVERRYPPHELPLARMVPGYEHNRDAAREILQWLDARYPLDPAIVEAIRTLL